MDRTEDRDSPIKTIIVDRYLHTEAGLSLTLQDMALHLLNEADIDLAAEDFQADQHEHAIPDYEMARIYILVCARTGHMLGFTPSDRDREPVYPLYEQAYQKLVRTERDKTLFLGIARVGQECGFLSESQLSAMH